MARADAPSDLARRHVFGLDLVDADSLDPVVDEILDTDVIVLDGDGELPVVLTPNVDIVVQLQAAPDAPETETYRRARYLLPDGMPVVVASRLLGSPLSARLTGSGLLERLWPRLVAEGRPVLVVCADHTIMERLGHRSSTAFIVPPYFDASDAAAVEAEADRIIALATAQPRWPEYVLIGLGHPKDALVAGALCDRWPHGVPRPLCLGVGGSFAMLVGLKRRAPAIMQRLGLEWFHRFCLEPRRLFVRYFVRDLAFVTVVAQEYRRRLPRTHRSHRAAHRLPPQGQSSDR
ncbi:MAG: WecB/TagA/CpsF family glycosyltransferase [Actinomycetota bacterium]